MRCSTKSFSILQDDLENAIGQTVDHGCAGLILWGNHYDESTSQEICLKYKNYVNNKLGPYISLLTEELETCSAGKCYSNGRCYDKDILEGGNFTSCKSTVKYGSVFKIKSKTAGNLNVAIT